MGFYPCSAFDHRADRKYYFIINPAAQNGKAMKVWHKLRQILERKEISFSFAVSNSAADVEMLAKNAAASAGAIVVGVGGDGTVSRIAAALFGTDAVMGVIPAGTGNDFVRTFNYPAALDEVCDVLLRGEIMELDIGMANGIFFCNAVGAGLDAEVAADAGTIFKKFTGSVRYMLALLRQLTVFKPLVFRITSDGDTIETKAWMVAVANGCYFGGGMKVAPQADARDGLLDIVIVSDIHRLHLLKVFPLIYSGRHIHHPAVRKRRGRSIRIECEKTMHVHADGEMLGETPLEVTMYRQALRMLVPGSL